MNNYGIREDYQARPVADYFRDVMPDGKVWQLEVYKAALHLARVHQVTELVDLGCGRATKLAPFMDEFKVIGVDYGENLNYCRQHCPDHQWIKQDFDKPMPDLDALANEQRVVICADTIEHLQNPTYLRDALVRMAQKAVAVVLSTPDRQRIHGYDRLEAPTNIHHTREWTLAEMLAWLPQDAPVAWAGWSRSNDTDASMHTMLIVMSRLPDVDGLLAGLDLEKAG